MSYILQIWEQPASRDFPVAIEEAVQFLEELHEADPALNPKFQALAQRLIQRYPALTDLPVAEGEDEPNFEHCAWSDGELSSESDDAVLNLGLNIAMVDEVQPFVVAEANALGLCVMDEQAGTAYLAGGRILEVQRATDQAPTRETKPDLPKFRELVKQLARGIAPLMKAHGYIATKGGVHFRRTFPGGSSEINFYEEDFWPVYVGIDVSGVISINQVNQLVDQFSLSKGSDITSVAAMRNWLGPDANKREFLGKYDNKYEVRNYSDLDEIIEHLKTMLATRLLPLLIACETLEGLDSVLNPAPPGKTLLGGFNRGEFDLVAAYFAKNPRLDEMLAVRAEWWKERSRYLLPLIDYIRANPL